MHGTCCGETWWVTGGSGLLIILRSLHPRMKYWYLALCIATARTSLSMSLCRCITWLSCMDEVTAQWCDPPSCGASEQSNILHDQYFWNNQNPVAMPVLDQSVAGQVGITGWVFTCQISWHPFCHFDCNCLGFFEQFGSWFHPIWTTWQA